MMHLEFHVRLMTAELAKRVCDHAVPRDGRRDSDSKRAGLAKGNPLGAALRAFDVLQDASHVV